VKFVFFYLCEFSFAEYKWWKSETIQSQLIRIPEREKHN
jgi:hypothetical protein